MAATQNSRNPRRPMDVGERQAARNMRTMGPDMYQAMMALRLSQPGQRTTATEDNAAARAKRESVKRAEESKNRTAAQNAANAPTRAQSRAASQKKRNQAR